ncbi:MAG: DUF3833 family protein [Alphaproteobacteria bacterium]
MTDPHATNKFKLEIFYSGMVHGWGHLIDHRGGRERAMTATVRGRWDGTALTLDQRYEPDGAPAERRIWLIRPDGDGYVGTAPSVVGTAAGRWEAGSLRWTYDMDVPAGSETWRVSCAEELTPQTDTVATSRIRIQKFGLLIAEMQLILSRARPIDPDPAR